MPELEVLTNNGEQRRLRIPEGPVVIGRGTESDVVLSDELLSRRHAEIGLRNGEFYLTDLRSTNGTFINGERVVGERRLRHGDLIALGQSRLVFSDGVPDTGEHVFLLGAQSYKIQELQSRVTSRAVEVVDLTRQTRVFHLLGKASSSLLGHRPLPELFERVLDVVFEAVPVERAAIALLEPRTGAPEMRAARSRTGEPITHVSRTISRSVVEQRVAVLIPNIFEDSMFRDRESIISTGLRSAICAPLWLAPRLGMVEEVIGLVYAETRNATRPFGRDDLEILTAVSNIAASKIESTRLQLMNVEKERLEGEIRIAAEIQRSIQPARAPEVPGCDIIGESRSCDAVGGDYHDFQWDGRELTITVADVSGKGLGAAMLMTSLRTAVHAHWGDHALNNVAMRINRTFFENVPVDRYATCFLARFDPRTGGLTYVSAGHTPTMIVRVDGTVQTLNEGGPGFGLFDTVEFDEGATMLAPGDTLLAYSDGVSESWPSVEEAESRLVELARHHARAPAATLQSEILAAVDRQNSGLRKDDCTVVVMRWQPGF